MHDLANPTEAHLMLREMVREWVQEHVEPRESKAYCVRLPNPMKILYWLLWITYIANSLVTAYK